MAAFSTLVFEGEVFCSLSSLTVLCRHRFSPISSSGNRLVLEDKTESISGPVCLRCQFPQEALPGSPSQSLLEQECSLHKPAKGNQGQRKELLMLLFEKGIRPP